MARTGEPYGTSKSRPAWIPPNGYESKYFIPMIGGPLVVAQPVMKIITKIDVKNFNRFIKIPKF